MPAGEPGTDETYALNNSTDFGDAPLPYPVTFTEDGARHEAAGPSLGAQRDSEVDGVHSAGASGDDSTGSQTTKTALRLVLFKSAS